LEYQTSKNPMAYKKKVKLSFSTPKRTQTDTVIEERLAACGRGEAEHIIYVGQLVERLLKSEFGAILKALTAGRASAELSSNLDGKISSDRILGRVEMANNLWNDLEQFVLDKDAQLRPIEQNEVKKETISHREPMDIREESFSYSP